MAALPPEMILPRDLLVSVQDDAPEAIVTGLAALHGKAAVLTMLARIGAEPAETEAALGALVDASSPLQRALVAQGIADCAAMLDSGLTALATLSARGQDASAPALALWREFHAARAGMLAVLKSPDAN